MKTRPWPIRILALMQLASPIASILVSAWKTRTPPLQFLTLLLKYGTFMQLFELFGLSILSGLAIYSVKKWSYPLFLAVVGWGLYSNVLVWMKFPQVYSFATLLTVNLLNLSLVTYFLIPAVRAAYFDPKLRWWESKPRYRVNFEASLKWDPSGSQASVFQKCPISDISEGGVFLRISDEIPLGEMVNVSFSIHELKFSLQGRVVHQARTPVRGIGIQFTDLQREDQRALRNATKGLDLLGYERRNPQVFWWEDFKAWASTLFKTGEGLIPQIQAHVQNTPKNVVKLASSSTTSNEKTGDKSAAEEKAA